LSVARGVLVIGKVIEYEDEQGAFANCGNVMRKNKIGVTIMKMANECENMNDIRKEIDELDGKIVGLIANRATYVKAAAKFKNNEVAVRDVKRVEAVINSKKVLAKSHGVSPKLIGDIYSIMIEHFVNEEMKEWSNK